MRNIINFDEPEMWRKDSQCLPNPGFAVRNLHIYGS